MDSLSNAYVTWPEHTVFIVNFEHVIAGWETLLYFVFEKLDDVLLKDADDVVVTMCQWIERENFQI